jgi:hypothetical protein
LVRAGICESTPKATNIRSNEHNPSIHRLIPNLKKKKCKKKKHFNTQLKRWNENSKQPIGCYYYNLCNFIIDGLIFEYYYCTATCGAKKEKEKVEDSTLNVHKNDNKFSHQARYTRSVFLMPQPRAVCRGLPVVGKEKEKKRLKTVH